MLACMLILRMQSIYRTIPLKQKSDATLTGSAELK